MSRDKKRGGGELPSHLFHACCFICAVTLRSLSCRTTRSSGERNTTFRMGGHSTSIPCPCRKCFFRGQTLHRKRFFSISWFDGNPVRNARSVTGKMCCV